MIRYRAAWLLPISGAPVRNGWVAIDGGRIAATGSGAEGGAIDLGPAVILPALVNAHTHLELSHLAGRVPPGSRFTAWVRALLERRASVEAADTSIVAEARRAIAQAVSCGTGLVGDVTNSLVTAPLLHDSPLSAVVFLEVIGFSVADPEARVAAARQRVADLGFGEGRVRASLAPHAPYSVAPALFRALRADLDRYPASRTTVHLAESPEEVEFLRHGTGGFRALLEDLGAWTEGWDAPQASPVQYLMDLAFLDPRVLVVHGVQLEGEDLSRLADRGVTLVTCPRSNRHVGAGEPPLEAFYAANLDVAIGTDSLASAPDLNLFSELKEMRRLAPRTPAARLLESATLIGARALGFEKELGTIEPGKRAALIAVRVPDGIDDVEEWLLGGIEPSAVSWLADDTRAEVTPVFGQAHA